MKNLLFFSLLAAFCLTASIGCDADGSDPGDVKLEADIRRDIIVSNPMAAGETFTSSFVIELREEFEESFGVSLNDYDLNLFEMDYITFDLDSEQCLKLASINVEFEIPTFDPLVYNKSGDALDTDCENKKATPNPLLPFIEVLALLNEDDPDYGQVFEHNFADEVTNGDRIIINYTMTAEEDIPFNNDALSFNIKTFADYSKK